MADVDVKYHEDFDEAKRKMSLAVQQCLEIVGQSAVTFARDLTPVDTGRLKNSMTFVTRESTGGHTYSDDHGKTYDGTLSVGADVGEVWFGTNVEYANYIENGTSKRGGKHMIKRAVDDHKSYYKAIMERYLASALK